jgi:hypothetical protein
MKVLVACEESGVVTSALRAKGIEAYSCDLLPTRGNPEWHLCCDVHSLLDKEWDAVLAFPPCTYLCTSRNPHKSKSDVQEATKEAIDFFLLFVDYAVKHPSCKVMIENPVGIMSTVYKKPTQYIQPYNFGTNVSKKTGLWLFNLPPLVPTEYVPPTKYTDKGFPRWKNQTPSGADKTLNGPNRARKRSTTHKGVAEAMVNQWF